MKPFDLQAALSGEPVQLSDGSKAAVFTDYRDTARKFGKEYNGDYPIRGVRVHNPGWEELSWTKSGRFSIDIEHHLDIVGMWEEPPATITIGGMEVPAPYTTAPPMGTGYYTPLICHVISYTDAIRLFRWCGMPGDMHRLKMGLAFKTKEDARAYHEAMSRHLTESFDAQIGVAK